MNVSNCQHSVNWGNAYQIVPTANCDDIADPASQPWFIRFAPIDHTQLVGNVEQREQIFQWFGTPSKLLVVGGSTGTGRTKTIELVAKHLKRRLLQPDIYDIRTINVLTGWFQKTKSESGILFLDDVQHMAVNAPACFAYLLKMIKTDVYKVKVVCCFDGTREQYPKMSPLINAADTMIEFEAISRSDMAPFLSKICKQANARLNYFDALSICQNSDGDLRAALVRLEFLFNSRQYDINKRNLDQKARKRKRIEDTNSIIVTCSACKDDQLLAINQAIGGTVTGKMKIKSIVVAADCEGVGFARTFATNVHKQYLQHCDSDHITEAIVQAADMLSLMDISLSPQLVDAEFADDLSDAELTAYSFRPQVAAANICYSILSCNPIAKAHPAKRNRRVKLHYP